MRARTNRIAAASDTAAIAKPLPAAALLKTQRAQQCDHCKQHDQMRPISSHTRPPTNALGASPSQPRECGHSRSACRPGYQRIGDQMKAVAVQAGQDQARACAPTSASYTLLATNWRPESIVRDAADGALFPSKVSQERAENEDQTATVGPVEQTEPNDRLTRTPRRVDGRSPVIPPCLKSVAPEDRA
jgi:hypothetical protein